MDRRRGGTCAGKSDDPGLSPGDDGARRPITDPGQVRDLLRDQSRRTSGRSELSRHPGLEKLSPQVGELDAAAVQDELNRDPDATLELLAAMTRATDEQLRAKARRLAASLLLPVAPPQREDPYGTGRLVTRPEQSLDLDLDATLERLTERPVPRPEDLRWRSWSRPARGYALVVDASGSTSGAPLTRAVLTAAAVAQRLRPRDQLTVVAFWSKVVVLRPLDSAAPMPDVLDALFDLRGGSTTDLGGGLRAAIEQLARCAGRLREVLVLTDGLANEGGDPIPVARSGARAGCRVHTLALSDEPDALAACAAIADAGGGRTAGLLRPTDAAGAVAHVLRS